MTRFGCRWKFRSARQIKERYSKLSSDIPMSPSQTTPDSSSGPTSSKERIIALVNMVEKIRSSTEAKSAIAMSGKEIDPSMSSSNLSGIVCEFMGEPPSSKVGDKRGYDEALAASSSLEHFSKRFQKLSPLELIEKLKEGVSLIPPRSPEPTIVPQPVLIPGPNEELEPSASSTAVSVVTTDVDVDASV